MHEPLTVLTLGTAHPDLFRVRRLYESAFPANERRPFEALLSGFDGQGELLAFYLGDCFAGFVSLLSWADITHILYFAIEEALRTALTPAFAARARTARSPYNGGDTSGKICRVLRRFDFACCKTFYDGPVPEFDPQRSVFE